MGLMTAKESVREKKRTTTRVAAIKERPALETGKQIKERRNNPNTDVKQGKEKREKKGIRDKKVNGQMGKRKVKRISTEQEKW